MTSSELEIWKSEILSIGTEILMGVITDSNASYISDKLPELGIGNYWTTAVGDNVGRIAEALERGLDRSDIIVTTGGLGPTDDDLTREAIALVLGEKPVIIPELETNLRARFVGRTMPDRNMKQATLIPSAEAISNPRGTAPGWWTETNEKVIISMPGVPREMFQMWQDEVVPRLKKRMEGRDHAIVTRTIKTLGIGEGHLDELIDEYLDSQNPKIGVYAKTDGVHVRINALGKNHDDAQSVLEPMELSLTDLLRPYIWGYDNDSVPVIIQKTLQDRDEGLAILEFCTGGHVTDAFTDVDQASNYFRGSFIASTIDSIIGIGVPQALVDDHGYVSEEVALAMAEAVRENLSAEIGIGVVGSLGPNPVGDIPAGTVFIAISSDTDRKVHQATFPQNRQDLRWRVRNAVLFNLLTWLHGNPE